MSTQLKYAIGDVLPDLNVTAADDQSTTLSQQMGERGLLLFVLRGTWCPFCVGQIHTMRRRYPKFTKLGVNTVFIVPEEKANVWGFAVSSPQPLPFILHADEENTIANDLTLKPEPPVSRPIGLYLLNPEREIVWRYVGYEDEDYPSHGKLLKIVNEHLGAATPDAAPPPTAAHPVADLSDS